MPPKIEVIGWVNWHSDHPEIDDWANQFPDYQKAVIDYVKEHQLCFSGTDHQYSENGAPLFSDGKKLIHSMRGWGRIMFEAHKEKFDDPKDEMGYAKFAWLLPDGFEKKLP